MENLLEPYAYQFTEEERRALIAQVLQEMRKNSGRSQKEVAAILHVAQPTYSGYERGRSEPPAEILVRLSYLYKVSLNVLMARDRLQKTAEDMRKELAKQQRDLAALQEQLGSGNISNEQMQAVLDAMNKLVEIQQKLLDKPDVRQMIDKPLSGSAE